jgi:hypothetical protein
MEWTTIDVNNGGTGLTSAGSSGQILVSDGTGFVLTTPTETSSGTFNPAITGPDTYMGYGFRYSRIGAIVHVSGAVEVSSASFGGSSFNIELPPLISSTFTSIYDVTGVVSGLNVLGDCGIFADTINNEANVKVTTTQTSSTVFVQFDFIIIQ